MGDIAARLNQSGYRTARGSLFETRVIGYILENPFYIGKIRWNFFNKQSNKRKNPDDVIISDGKHEAIISEEQFSKAANTTDSARDITRNAALLHSLPTGCPA
jgi:site-specific DNA recombinase